MTTFGERLRLERERLGLTQAEMAALFEGHKNTQYAYETGQQSPNAATLATANQQMTELLTLLHGLAPTHQALGFGMVSMLFATLNDADTSANKATILWQAVRLFNQFLAGNDAEREILLKTCQILCDSNPAVGA
jgi:transcriptional regulator with XRE-family HTH domain